MCSQCERENGGKHEGNSPSDSKTIMKEEEQVLQVQS